MVGGAESEARMTNPNVPDSSSQGLAFLALLSFVVGFFAARAFATINPNVVVVSSGIHFHHFWYGLALVIGSGWLGIASIRPEHDRAFAVIFGLGLGLIGDETGLLLTLGDYHSELTYVVFVATLSAVVLALLVVRFWAQLRDEVFRLGRGETAIHLGIGVAAISALPLAFGFLIPGVIVLAIGLLVASSGTWLHLRGLRNVY